MMKKLLFVLAVVLAFARCAPQKEAMPPVEPTPYIYDSVNLLALGDSYTIGQSVAEAERWPNQLADSLKKAGLVMKSVKIIAKTGWTTANLDVGINATAGMDTARFNLVGLLIGVNNQYQHKPLAAYRTEFAAMLERAIVFAGGRTERVFVVSIPDYAFTPFGNGSTTISSEIDQFNAANRDLTELRGVRYFDITPISRLGLADPSLVAVDGLHPSGGQYARWVAGFWKEVRGMVRI
jgi:lysophospholipase L1-like esterase